MKLHYNSPVVLTYALICSAVLILNGIFAGFTQEYFMLLPRFDFANPLSYFRLFSHVIGHQDWTHLASNFAFILLIGPILEEKYGWKKMLLMILVTAFITGVLNLIFYDHALLGASGIAFMMILLGSMVSLKNNQIPLTFVLIVLIYFGKELYMAFSEHNRVSEFSHILGGICGMLFGFSIKR